MQGIQVFNVAPSIPKNIRFLETLSRNLWWSWNEDAANLFRQIDPPLWRDVGYNPIVFLRKLPHHVFDVLSDDASFLEQLNDLKKKFDKATGRGVAKTPTTCIAYASLEFGLHETVRLYSGGLGVLAGDHLKSASDLGVPLVAVGLFYSQGYFSQFLTEDGWQQERYPDTEIQDMPVRLARDTEGKEVIISVPLPEGEIKAKVWQLDVGCVPLILLDSNIPENHQDLRHVTSRLYGGDKHNRLLQELLLGIGGFRALIALGYTPEACHLNEGHAAFMGLARISHLCSTTGIDQDTAFELVSRSNVFTTHTPVPAGNETFPVDMLTPFLSALEPFLGISPEKVLTWGGAAPKSKSHDLSMTVLGLHLSHHNNGVSKLHGEVARGMWRHLWPNHLIGEVPITHITNGVHASTWLSGEMKALLDRYVGPKWETKFLDDSIMDRVFEIPDEELWHAHERTRSRLIRVAREHAESQNLARYSNSREMAIARSILDSDALTIGFARRFATYKRGGLLLSDVERFEAILKDADRPVQFIFSGKAHPADDPGKHVIQSIVEFSKRAGLERKMIFLENYDMRIARFLVQGVDVWLNTPRRPHEASGTSGMKAALNGAPNASILDGWWCEGYSPESGWAIGDGEEHQDSMYEDQIEAHALYNLLETQIVPSFYDRSGSADPHSWIQMMKGSIRMALNFFTSHRMVREYQQKFYDHSVANYRELAADNAQKAVELVKTRERLSTLWPLVYAEKPVTSVESGSLHAGDDFSVDTVVHLGELSPEEVDVHVCFGILDKGNELKSVNYVEMEQSEKSAAGPYKFSQTIHCKVSGRYGLSVRITPRGDDWKTAMPGFIAWAKD